MYLSQISIENFRVFGDKSSGKHLDLELSKGLTLVVGENDSGKSSLLDAIRLVLGTTSNDITRLTADDFHVDASGKRAQDVRIKCQFSDLDADEAAALLEWLTVEQQGTKSQYRLYVSLEAHRREVRARFDREIAVTVKAGADDAGVSLDGAAREIVRATYLKALRDAEQELAAKRGSRLSQILMAHPVMKEQAKLDLKAELRDDSAGAAENSASVAEPKMVSIVQSANKAITDHSAVQSTVKDLNEKYLGKFTLGDDHLRGEVGIADPELKRILEQLQLGLRDDSSESTRHGLGLNNLLFIATELLLLESGANGSVPLALIEEPEAHLHPQLQIRLMEALEGSQAQVIVTSHSPNLASVVDLERLVVMRKGKAFPMMSKYTRLDQSDYEFLRRFLDVTKANLFFARGVMIVEGDAEQLLIPTIADLIGSPFSKYGVSVVSVGHVGLFRYSRIFQRQADPQLDVRVACVTDRDVPTDPAREYIKPERKTESEFQPDELTEKVNERGAKFQGGPVRAFISPKWTLEHDLALFGLSHEVHQAVKVAEVSKKKSGIVSQAEIEVAINAAESEIKEWEASGLSAEQIASTVYRPLYKKAASKAETAQYLAAILTKAYQNSSEELRRKLPTYLVEAIDYVVGK